MAQAPVAPLDANRLLLLQTSDNQHKWYKRYIKTLVDNEKSAAEDWKMAQDDHMKYSLELQREQTALALIREMLADNLVGTVDDVEQQVNMVIQEAMKLAESTPGALPTPDLQYCKTSAFIAAAPVQGQLRTVDWSTRIPPLQRSRLAELFKKLALDKKRVDQLRKNVMARELACKTLTEQVKNMALQCKRMERVRANIGDALKTVWTDEVANSPDVRRRFRELQSQAETRAKAMTKSTTERLTKLINAESVHLAKPQGAVTWLNSWAQLGRRSHATPLCPTDYKLEKPEVLYSSGDDDDAQQAAGTSGASQPPQPPSGGMEQAIQMERVKRKRDKAMAVLKAHVKERRDYMLNQYDHDATGIRMFWVPTTDDQISPFGNLVVEGTTQATGAVHYLNLYDPEIRKTWLEWGDRQEIPPDVIDEMITEYIGMITEAVAEIEKVLKDKYGWKGEVKYKTASELDALYNENRDTHGPSTPRTLMKHCLVFGASETTYKFQKRDEDQHDAEAWGEKFEDRQDVFTNWHYHRERTIGFVTNLEHGLPIKDLVAEKLLDPMYMADDGDSDNESSDDAAGVLPLRTQRDDKEAAEEEEKKRQKHVNDFLAKKKALEVKKQRAAQRKVEKERGRIWKVYVGGVQAGGFALEGQGEAQDAQSWLIRHHKQWFEDAKKTFEADRKKEQEAKRKEENDRAIEEGIEDALREQGLYVNEDLQELGDLPF